jgi:hypothetical protein
MTKIREPVPVPSLLVYATNRPSGENVAPSGSVEDTPATCSAFWSRMEYIHKVAASPFTALNEK